MASFFSSLGEEFMARRARMRAAFGDNNGTLFEFLLFAGIVAGLFAAVLGQLRGLAPLIALIAGYLLLEFTRQNSLARGADEVQLRRRQDRLVFILFAAMAAFGAAFLFIALQPPPHKFTHPPPGVPLNVDLAP